MPIEFDFITNYINTIIANANSQQHEDFSFVSLSLSLPTRSRQKIKIVSTRRCLVLYPTNHILYIKVCILRELFRIVISDCLNANKHPYKFMFFFFSCLGFFQVNSVFMYLIYIYIYSTDLTFYRTVFKTPHHLDGF
jgi:hypothetical protein